MVAYREVNEGLPNAAVIAADNFQTTRILDRNGTLLQEIADQDSGWRTFVPYDKISPSGRRHRRGRGRDLLEP